MSLRKTLLVSFLLTLGVWAFFSWPLPCHFTKGIPSSATNVGRDNVRRMIQGDHLQLLYNYWLFSDMVAGKTPIFHNLYEFNTGNDAERRTVGCYNVPFSMLFTLGYWIGGRAAGWNITGFVCLWMTHLLMWILLRRYAVSEWASALAAVVAIALPYRWAMMLGGSPAGNAMLWVPMLMLGLDSAIRRASFGGGCLAAFAILFSHWNDGHVFLLNVLLVPCWSVLVLVHADDPPWRDARTFWRTCLALLPFAAMVLLVVGLTLTEVKTVMAGSNLSGGRSWNEVALYSPHAHGLIAWRGMGRAGGIYLGWIVPLVLVAGLLLQSIAFLKQPASQWRKTLTLILILAGCTLAIALALGTYGPLEGRLFAWARRGIPQFEKLRQPAKIFCVLPPLLAVAAAMSMDRLGGLLKSRRAARAALALLGLGFVVEYGLQIQPTICLLDSTQDAYRAVADDARQNDRDPRAVVVPLWPGDSSWASLYEHYVSLYRIRMINGYRPIIPREYMEQIFDVFGTVNIGELSDDVLNDLQKRGVDYVLLHEDAFPEKVSPFPVAFTLQRLLNHPRLALLRQDKSVWAFKIMDKPISRDPVKPGWNIFFPTRSMDFAAAARTDCLVKKDDAGGAPYLSLGTKGARAALRTIYLWHAPAVSLLIRVRGHGALQLGLVTDGVATNRQRLNVSSDSWTWKQVPLKKPAEIRDLRVELEWASGSVDADRLTYYSGAWPSRFQVGESLTLAAPLFFHAGFTDLASDSIRLRVDYEPADAIFYGPKLPLTEGRYDTEMVFATAAPEGTELGYFAIEQNGVRSQPFPVVSGKPATGSFSTQAGNLPFTLVFVYSRNADMEIDRVVFTRTE